MSAPAAELTAQQRKILDFIAAFADQRGYPPSYREIAEELDRAAGGGIAYQLGELVGKGVLAREPGKARCLRVVQPPARRSWVFPSQPGREVTHVSTPTGETWLRFPDPAAPEREDLDKWVIAVEDATDFVVSASWPDLLETSGELTDATPEVGQ